MRRRAAAAVAVAVVLGLTAVGAVAFVASRHSDDPELTTQELAAYQDAVLPPLRDGGRVVQQQMKPALSDLETATGPAATRLVADAAAWASQLAAVRTQVAAVTPPAPLRDSAAGFDRALARYIDAAREFGAAARVAQTSRAPILAKGYDIAREADSLYDTASAVIQRWRRRLGLGPTADFPDPERT